ncbi:MAG: YtxH domain-containing protein [Gemmatimonadales bacterium]
MTAADKPEGKRAPARRPKGRPYKNVPDTGSVSMLGIGMVVGAVIGAGVALLFAPQSGAETRSSISQRARKVRRGTGAWTRLGRELRRAAKIRQQKIEIETKRAQIVATEGATVEARPT